MHSEMCCCSAASHATAQWPPPWMPSNSIICHMVSGTPTQPDSAGETVRQDTEHSLVSPFSLSAVFRLYEDVSRPLDDPLRYYVNVQFSPGAALDPFIFAEEGHTLPVSRPVPVNGRIPFHLFKLIFSGSMSESQPPRGYVHPWMHATGSQQHQQQSYMGMSQQGHSASSNPPASATNGQPAQPAPSTPGAASTVPSPRR
jgi:hypothetical protein